MPGCVFFFSNVECDHSEAPPMAGSTPKHLLKKLFQKGALEPRWAFEAREEKQQEPLGQISG